MPEKIYHGLTVITGPMASGKTTLALGLAQSGYTIVKMITTRPKRKDEPETYMHAREFQYNQLEAQGSLISSMKFGSWFYALRDDRRFYEPDGKMVLACDIQTMLNLKEFVAQVRLGDISPSQLILVDAPRDLRLRRAMNRGDEPREIIRRFDHEKTIYPSRLERLRIIPHTSITTTEKP